MAVGAGVIFNPYLGMAALAGAGALFLGGYWFGHSAASDSASAARLSSENAALVELIGVMAERTATINAAAEADAERALRDAARLAELQEMIDAIPDDGNVCLPASSAQRLRNIR